jgi:hypothetical protein
MVTFLIFFGALWVLIRVYAVLAHRFSSSGYDAMPVWRNVSMDRNGRPCRASLLDRLTLTNRGEALGGAYSVARRVRR